jgi:predicted nucleotidyltransferase
MDRPPLAQPLVAHHDEIVALCRRYGVERLEVFGSAADGRFDPVRSDFDFIVRLARDHVANQGSLGRRFVGLAEALEAVLGRTVDLIPDKPIGNPYFRRAVDATRRVLYDRAVAEAPA